MEDEEFNEDQMPFLTYRNNEDSADTESDEHDDRIENDVYNDSQIESSSSSSSSSSDNDTPQNSPKDENTNSEREEENDEIERHHHHHHSHHHHRRESRRISYDSSLPAQHSYLGNDLKEVQSYDYVEDDSEVVLPLLSIEGVVLVPGQTLPLVFNHPSYVALLRNIVEMNKVFGFYSERVNLPDQPKDMAKFPQNALKIGTTATIRNYGEEDSDTERPTIKIKVEGKQRFQVISTWRDVRGMIMGKLRILPEISNSNPNRTAMGLFGHSNLKRNRKQLSACTPFPSFVYDQYDEEQLVDKIGEQLHHWAAGARDLNENNQHVQERRVVRETIGDLSLLDSLQNQQRDDLDEASPEPPRQAQITRTIVTRVRSSMDDESDTESEDEKDYFAPTIPSSFSYWVISNLPLKDYFRLQALSLNSSVQRLRFEFNILCKYFNICCHNCNAKICRRDDVFSMSVSGPQGAYVNPHGIVHEMFTADNATSLKTFGMSSVQYSWFPGYAWIICNCSYCDTHIGWKFIATNKNLKPESFWGIRRCSVTNGWKSDDHWMPVF